MSESIEFVKLSGSGNDFICVDGRSGRFDGLFSAGAAGHFARTLCRRGPGVGADGVLFATTPEIEQVADMGARFFEPDGSEAELCGNGTACFVYWAVTSGWLPDREIKVLTPAGVILGQMADGQYVRVCIPDPEDVQTDLELDVKGSPWKCDFVVTGVPHVISYVEGLETMDVAHWGKAFRHHRRFQPRGANANFVEVLGEGEIALRTFEFGVERETLSCGTGSAAAAIMTALRFGWSGKYLAGAEPVRVRARGGDILKVWFRLHPDHAVTDVCLETAVRCVFTGKLCPEVAERALNRECSE